MFAAATKLYILHSLSDVCVSVCGRCKHIRQIGERKQLSIFNIVWDYRVVGNNGNRAAANEKLFTCTCKLIRPLGAHQKIASFMRSHANHKQNILYQMDANRSVRNEVGQLNCHCATQRCRHNCFTLLWWFRRRTKLCVAHATAARRLAIISFILSCSVLILVFAYFDMENPFELCCHARCRVNGNGRRTEQNSHI